MRLSKNSRSSWKRTLGWGLLGLVALLVLFVGAAYWAYYSPKAADLPCRNCSGDARLVQVLGFDLYYRELGTDTTLPPVVVLHGGPGHSSQSFKESLDFLARDRRLVYYDQRGSGNSQIKPDPSLYTVEQLVQELETLRRDVIRADKIVLVGHSAGGALAQRYALAYPEHVDRLVLVSSIQINNGVRAAFLWHATFPALFYLAAGSPPADPQTANEWFRSMLVATSLPRLYDPANQGLIEDSGYVSFATYREVSRSLDGPDYKSALQQMPVKTLVMYGAADASTTGKANAEYLCGLIPDCELAGFDHSGHWPFLEEPARFAEVLTHFLAEK